MAFDGGDSVFLVTWMITLMYVRPVPLIRDVKEPLRTTCSDVPEWKKCSHFLVSSMKMKQIYSK